MDRIGDYKARYYDGASGGWGNTLTRGILNGNNLIPGSRRRAGMKMGLKDAADIINNIEEGESIKIVSHSYGGAYAKGFVKGLLKYAEESGKDINIEYEVDFAPFQAGSQEAVDGVPTTQISHTYDNVSNTPEPHWLLGWLNPVRPNSKIKGANVIYNNDSEKGHSIFDFEDEIELIPKSKNNGTYDGNYHIQHEEKP